MLGRGIVEIQNVHRTAQGRIDIVLTKTVNRRENASREQDGDVHDSNSEDSDGKLSNQRT
jgi:hypothetical protein